MTSCPDWRQQLPSLSKLGTFDARWQPFAQHAVDGLSRGVPGNQLLQGGENQRIYAQHPLMVSANSGPAHAFSGDREFRAALQSTQPYESQPRECTGKAATFAQTLAPAWRFTAQVDFDSSRSGQPRDSVDLSQQDYALTPQRGVSHRDAAASDCRSRCKGAELHTTAALSHDPGSWFQAPEKLTKAGSVIRIGLVFWECFVHGAGYCQHSPPSPLLSSFWVHLRGWSAYLAISMVQTFACASSHLE